MREILTNGDIRRAVCLQEAVEVLPGLRDPVNDLNQVIAAHVLIDLRLYQLPPQEATQETFDRLSVVGAQHPPTTGQMINGVIRAAGANKTTHRSIRCLIITAAHIKDDVTCAVSV